MPETSGSHAHLAAEHHEMPVNRCINVNQGISAVPPLGSYDEVAVQCGWPCGPIRCRPRLCYSIREPSTFGVLHCLYRKIYLNCSFSTNNSAVCAAVWMPRSADRPPNSASWGSLCSRQPSVGISSSTNKRTLHPWRSSPTRLRAASPTPART